MWTKISLDEAIQVASERQLEKTLSCFGSRIANDDDDDDS